MKANRKFLCVLLVCALLLSGCGPTTGPQTQPTKPEATTSPVLPDVPTEPSVPATQPTEPSVPVTQPTEPSVPVTQPTEPSVPETIPTEPTEPESIPVQNITLSAPKTTISVMEEVQITAAIEPENADVLTVMYETTGGQVLDNGVFFAAEPGVYVITARAMDESGASATITIIVEAAPVTDIAITGDKRVTVGKTLQLTAVVAPEYATDPTVTWSIVSGEEFASIDQNGVLTAIAVGKVTVQASANDGSGVKATHKVEVTPVLVNKITISGEKTVQTGQTLQLSASVKPENAADKGVSWSISKGEKYATIDENGVLTALKAGSVTVKATARDGSGVSATFKITVEEAAMWAGSGTKDDPFLIRCLEDLLNLRNVLDKSGYYYRQVADIDCASVETWVVIGDEEHPFRHHIDGGGYTISNLCLDGEAMGLFSWVKGSHFKNMKIVNAHTKDNHRTEENNSAKLPGNGGSTAAFVGYGEDCSFENCSATVNFKSSNSATGGLIGAVVLKNEKYAFMKNCHVSGTVTGSGYTGGLVGNISTSLSDGEYMPAHTITVENCSADVEIVIFTTSIESACVGGLIGKSFGVKIVNCHTKGSINVVDGDIGGLVGDAGNYTDVTRCYSEMDIYISSDDHYGGVSAGGLIGHIYSRSDVYDCYATGNISAPYVEWSPCQDSTNKNGGPWRRYYNPCGSLIGTLEVFKAYSEDQKITVYNCYATGKVNVPNICEDQRVYCHGALIGLILDRNTVVSHNMKDASKKELTSWDDFKEYYIGHFGDNYNLEDLRNYYEPINDYEGANVLGLQNPKYTKLPNHEYVQIITQDALKNQATFVGWDFETIWQMGANGPELRK